MTKSELMTYGITRAQAEYLEHVETWKQLDTKGQGTTAIAGFLLGAVLIFIGKSEIKLDAHELLIIRATVGILTLAVALALGCLWTRRTAGTPSCETVLAIVLGKANDFDQLHENNLRDWLKAWSGAIQATVAANASKSKWLVAAQLALVAATLLTAALVFLVVS